MICRELILICATCRERHVNIVERGDKIVVYADLMRELFDSIMKKVVESHVAKCANEIAGALTGKAERWGWQEVNEKMRFFYVVKKS